MGGADLFNEDRAGVLAVAQKWQLEKERGPHDDRPPTDCPRQMTSRVRRSDASVAQALTIGVSRPTPLA